MLDDLVPSEVEQPKQTNALPFVSVVVPTWNHPAYLRGCLESLIAQEYPRSAYEIIVADDGSSAETAAVIQGVKAQADSLRIYHCWQEHRGVNAARNLGVKKARGVLIGFVDDDELAPPGFLKRAVSLMDQYPDVMGVGGPCREWGPNVLRACSRCHLGARVGPSQRSMKEKSLPGGNMIIRRRAFVEFGRFDEEISGYGDDWEWFMRIRRRAAVNFLYDPELWVWHRKDLLSPWHLITTAFRQGLAIPVATSKVQVPRRPNLMPIARYFGHAIFRRCCGGLILAARHTGALVGYVQLRLGWRTIS